MVSMSVILSSFGVKQAQFTVMERSAIFSTASSTDEKSGSRVLKFLSPTQDSSPTTTPPLLSTTKWSFQFGMAIGEPDISTLGAPFAATPRLI